MRILLTNDDGYNALGIKAVFASLVHAGHDVIMIAPERNSSGAGQSIAIYHSIAISQVEDKIYYVTSSPADSVRLGLQAVYVTPDNYPDLVISGINLGENIAEDVLYSGTVGAAREGTLHGIPSLAISTNGVGNLDGEYLHLDSASRIVVELVDKIEQNLRFLPRNFLWNVNIPNQPYDRIDGYETTKLGLRPLHQPLIEQTTPRGHKIYWQGYSSLPDEFELGTDLQVFYQQKKVSITPLEILPTNYEHMPIVDALIG
ncbi:MAG: 5/3-nucleotidase SurE [Pseudomonadota bacterium]|jgi:5'-nucleotidase